MAVATIDCSSPCGLGRSALCQNSFSLLSHCEKNLRAGVGKAIGRTSDCGLGRLPSTSGVLRVGQLGSTSMWTVARYGGCYCFVGFNSAIFLIDRAVVVCRFWRVVFVARDFCRVESR